MPKNKNRRSFEKYWIKYFNILFYFYFINNVNNKGMAVNSMLLIKQNNFVKSIVYRIIFS